MPNISPRSYQEDFLNFAYTRSGSLVQEEPVNQLDGNLTVAEISELDSTPDTVPSVQEFDVTLTGSTATNRYLGLTDSFTTETDRYLPESIRYSMEADILRRNILRVNIPIPSLAELYNQTPYIILPGQELAQEFSANITTPADIVFSRTKRMITKIKKEEEMSIEDKILFEMLKEQKRE